MNQHKKHLGAVPSLLKLCPSRLSKETGVALLSALMILALLTLVGITALRMTGLQEKMTGNQKLLTIAQFASEQGISEAIDDLVDETISDSGSESSTSWSATGSATGTGYSAAYTVRHKLVGGVVATDPEGLPYYIITSKGTSNVARSRDVEVAIRLIYTSLFDTGLVGCDGVTFSSNADTSSYSSAGDTTSGDNGDIGTVNPNGDVTLDSGNVIAGSLAITGSLTMSSNANVQKSV